MCLKFVVLYLGIFPFRDSIATEVSNGGALIKHGSTFTSQQVTVQGIGFKRIYNVGNLISQAPGHVLDVNNQIEFVGEAGPYALAYGPYSNLPTDVSVIHAYFVFEKFQFDGYLQEYCVQYQRPPRTPGYRRICHHRPKPHGLVYELVTDKGKIRLAGGVISGHDFIDPIEFEDKHSSRYLKSVSLKIYPQEPITNLELRMMNPYGGKLNLKIKYVIFDIFSEKVY